MEKRHTIRSQRLQSALIWLVILFAIGAVVMGGVNLMLSMAEPRASVLLGDGVFKARIASTEAERKKGLGGVRELHSQDALLMMFPNDNKWTIWMKGMHIPIDIVWLDSKNKVVHIEKDVQPDVEPYEVYAPEKDARYVVELKAGSVQKYKIKLNEVAVMDTSKVQVE